MRVVFVIWNWLRFALPISEVFLFYICTSGRAAALPEVPFHGRGRSGEQYFLFTVPVTGKVVPGSSISAPATAGAAELLPSTAAQRLPFRGSWHGASRDRGSFLTFFQISEIYA